ncbi:uncharacterized protein [Struthio camelus]|uniref:uncharacterized protein n=1 Tax=Struthio camelus TaxID=8801 RepID=UPI00360429BE
MWLSPPPGLTHSSRRLFEDASCLSFGSAAGTVISEPSRWHLGLLLHTDMPPHAKLPLGVHDDGSERRWYGVAWQEHLGLSTASVCITVVIGEGAAPTFISFLVPALLLHLKGGPKLRMHMMLCPVALIPRCPGEGLVTFIPSGTHAQASFLLILADRGEQVVSHLRLTYSGARKSSEKLPKAWSLHSVRPTHPFIERFNQMNNTESTQTLTSDYPCFLQERLFSD